MAEYLVSLNIEADDMQDLMGRVYGFIDKHGEGRPNGITQIAITEIK